MGEQAGMECGHCGQQAEGKQRLAGSGANTSGLSLGWLGRKEGLKVFCLEVILMMESRACTLPLNYNLKTVAFRSLKRRIVHCRG